MKRVLHFAFAAVLTVFSIRQTIAQNIGISSDGSLPDPHAMLDIKAADKGLLIPRTSTSTRLLIPNTKGLLLYDTTTSTFWFNDGAQWQQISNGSSALSGTTNYIAKFTSSSTAGNSQIYDNGQYVGFGTTSPLARLHVIDSSVLFSATGDIPAVIHDVPISYNGRRMMWYADKAAFRAGYTVYDEWNSVNIGNYSVGMGYGNMATGLYSVSLGHGSGASGVSSTATGDYNNANGDYTFSTGQYSVSKKPYCFSAGYTAEANGQASIAMGYQAVADGDYGVALGHFAFAPSISSVSLGYNNAANGAYSLACGINTKANGNTSFSTGNATTAAGDYSFTAGASTQANGFGAVATGEFTLAGGDFSTAMGSHAQATNTYCVAMGVNATASGGASFALGTNITAGGSNSFVWGQNSNTTGAASLVMGINLFDGGHKGNAMFGDTDPWNAGSVGSGTDDQMICRFNNGYYFLTGGNTNRTGIVANHGDNSWSVISDSTKKEKIVPVNGEELLQKISTFTLCTWNYKGQDPKTFRHYGPMAQDFHKAFGHDAYGTIGNDTLINQGDFLGVSFTAIAALEKRTEKILQQQDQIRQLENENKILMTENKKLQVMMDLLNKNLSALTQKVQVIAMEQKDSDALAGK
jgi:hypothetical protein